MCGYNRCSQSHVYCFLTSVPTNGELRLSGQAVDLAGRRRLRDQSTVVPVSPATAVGCLSVPKTTLSEWRSKPEAIVQKPGSDSQPLVTGRTLKQVEMREIALKPCAHERSRPRMPGATKLDPLKLKSLKRGAHRHWGALACVCLHSPCGASHPPTLNSSSQGPQFKHMPFFPFSFPPRLKVFFVQGA